jgi:hypothetical protein
VRSAAASHLPSVDQPGDRASERRLPVEMDADPTSAMSLTARRSPFSHAPWPRSAQAVSPNMVPADTPSTICPPRINAIWVEKNG